MLLQHAVLSIGQQLADDVAWCHFQHLVTPGREAVMHLVQPDRLVTPSAFFGSTPLSTEELQMAEELHCRVTSAYSPTQAQQLMQLFLNEGIEMNSVALARYALAVGAQANHWDHLGRLPLINAVQVANLNLVHMLLRAGANPIKSSGLDCNAIELAHRQMMQCSDPRQEVQIKEIFTLLLAASCGQLRLV